ncbi:MAG: sugar transferase [Propionicimonas sp.]|nr:sugar transferase [Propionicimonas sp.]
MVTFVCSRSWSIDGMGRLGKRAAMVGSPLERGKRAVKGSVAITRTSYYDGFEAVVREFAAHPVDFRRGCIGLTELPDAGLRCPLVKPGVAGLWQVNGRSGLSSEESIRLDLSCVDNWPPSVDIVIILKTLHAVMRRDGAHRVKRRTFSGGCSVLSPVRRLRMVLGRDATWFVIDGLAARLNKAMAAQRSVGARG